MHISSHRARAVLRVTDELPDVGVIGHLQVGEFTTQGLQGGLGGLGGALVAALDRPGEDPALQEAARDGELADAGEVLEPALRRRHDPALPGQRAGDGAPLERRNQLEVVLEVIAGELRDHRPRRPDD